MWIRSEWASIGLQIVGKPFDEETVLKLGHAFDRGSDWPTLPGARWLSCSDGVECARVARDPEDLYSHAGRRRSPAIRQIADALVPPISWREALSIFHLPDHRLADT
jgi:hypothetical protein